MNKGYPIYETYEEVVERYRLIYPKGNFRIFKHLTKNKWIVYIFKEDGVDIFEEDIRVKSWRELKWV